MSPLSHSERFALATLAVAWVAPAWWLGASTVQSQFFAVTAGTLAVLVALLARRTPSAVQRPPFTALAVVGCLVAFVALLLCQALNPDRMLVPDRRPVGLLQPLDHTAWLPTGIAGPFDRLLGDFLLFADAWRHLLVAGAALLPLFACALVLRRPAVLRALLGLLFIHAVLFSTFALAHNLSGSKAVLWMVNDAASHLGAPQFPFKNQQASYQLLLLALALGAWLAPESCRPWSAAPHRARWFAFGLCLVFLGTVTTRSRFALAGALALSGLVALLILWPHRHAWRRHRRGLAIAGTAVLFSLAGLACVPPVRATLGRVAELAREPGDLLVGGSYRRILRDIAWEMTKDRPWFGHGAGCYVLLFTSYHPRVPAFMEAVRRHQPNWNRPVHVHADSDWIEFTAEYGAVGTALFAAPWLFWLATLRRLRPLAPAVVLTASGTMLVLAHGWIDFVLRNPAILGLAAATAVISVAIARSPSSSAPLSA